MEKNGSNQIVILGIGNTIRSDDGIGSFVCSMMDQLNLPYVTTLTVHQLNTEIIEELLPYDHILLVDASLDGDDVVLQPVLPDESQAYSSSHYMNAVMLQVMAQKVYGKSLSIFTCAIKGENFEIGEQLSDIAIINIGKAITKLQSWIGAIHKTLS